MSKRDYIFAKADRAFDEIEKGMPSALRGKKGLSTYFSAMKSDPRAVKRIEELAERQTKGKARARGIAVLREMDRPGY